MHLGTPLSPSSTRVMLLGTLKQAYPIHVVIGHSNIAPGARPTKDVLRLGTGADVVRSRIGCGFPGA